ncbi:MAG: OmpA family protein [Myxococcales bacterium]|nr:OmpA family protein [Polyangiaceae bacterium]MDW8249456.1 OmpA family protein [Myxococcales bacterium]
MSLRLRWVLFSLSTVTLIPTLGLAEEAKSGEFSVQRFQPAPGPRNFFTVQGARTDGKMAWSAGVFVNYSDSPFLLKSCKAVDNCSEPNAIQSRDIKVIKSMVTGDALASLTPTPRLQLGLRIPVSYVQGDGIDTTTGNASKNGLKATGLGDPMLEAKLRALGEVDSPLVLGGAVFLSGPLGNATAKDSYIGDRGPVAGIRGILDGRTGPFDFAANIAGLYRQPSRLGSTELGPEFRYGVAGGFRVSQVVRIVAEGFGSTKFSSKAGTSSLETDLGLQISPLHTGVHLTLGGGPGVLQGVGVPIFRAFAGVMYVGEMGDSDSDGLRDSDDKCPMEREDLDGFDDKDGCPDYDNDGDGIKDENDKCPNNPESMNGFQDEDGCPDEIPDADKDGISDEDDKCPNDGGPNVVRAKGQFYGCPDNDKDGIPDSKDKCPNEPEDTDGFQDEDGCPDPDNDGDGVPDLEDECADIPGTKEMRGCPDPDSDGDGIPDSKDKCPKEPETYNGFKDDDGCSDKAPGSLVEVTDDGIKILDQVQFATNSDKIVGPKSFKILDQVASVLAANESIFLVEVAGHTDNVGSAEANKSLSQRRAEAVVAYLVDKKNINRKRLVAKGYGQEKPIADNNSAKGRQQNRRVEFIILKSIKKATSSGPAPSAPTPENP